MTTMRTLQPLFSPRSIAVIGASASPEKAGYAMMQSLQSFAGMLYPINPRGGDILGFPSYSSVADVPVLPDLAVLVVPAAAVPDSLEQLGALGVAAAVICSGGFAESGPRGAALQARIVEIAQRTGIRILGPNTSGFANPADGVFANFMPAVTTLHAGGAAVVAQSGGVNLALSFLLARVGVGVRVAVGLGNAVDVDFVDVLDHLADDDETKVVALHVEGVSDGRTLMNSLRYLTARKPVVALKVGKNDVGDFAKSHTGALTGSYEIAREGLRHAGVVVVDSPTDLVDAIAALGSVRLPASKRPGVGIITGQAGPGLIIADALATRGVTLPLLEEKTVAALGTLLPPLTYQLNPVDTGRPGDNFPSIVNSVATDASIDLIGVYALDEPGALNPVRALAGSPVPVLFASGGPAADLQARRESLRSINVPLFESPDALARGLAALVDDAIAQSRAVASVELPAQERLGGPINEDSSKELITAYGVRVPKRRVVADHFAAAAALAEIGGRVVVKVVDEMILHKSDVGGVHLDISTQDALDRALTIIDAIPGSSARAYLIEQMAEMGPELIVGAIRDPAFGPVVLLALGGVDVELSPDPILMIAPVSALAADAAIDRLPGSIVAGHRGELPLDRQSLVRVIRAVSDLVSRFEDITEIDLNPVRIVAGKATVLDALIVTIEKSLQENHVN